MQVPVVGLQPLRSVEQPGADDIFFAPSMWMVNSSRRSLSRQVRSLDGVCRLSSACLLRLAKGEGVSRVSRVSRCAMYRVYRVAAGRFENLEVLCFAISCLESFTWRRQMAAFDFAVFRIKVRCTVCEIVFFFFQRMSLSLLFLLHFHLPHKWMSQLKRNSNNIPLKNLGLSQNWFQWIWNDSQLASNNSQIIFNIVSNSVN